MAEGLHRKHAVTISDACSRNASFQRSRNCSEPRIITALCSAPEDNYFQAPSMRSQRKYSQPASGIRKKMLRPSNSIEVGVEVKET
jgi:hypothetical protein